MPRVISSSAVVVVAIVANFLFVLLGDVRSDLQPLMTVEVEPGNAAIPPRSAMDTFLATYFESNPEFFKQAFTFAFCFVALQASYLTWGYMQGELH
jgi:hypothetical protein